MALSVVTVSWSTSTALHDCDCLRRLATREFLS
jgi:hypothetical protein